jgi:hypothetical protein
LLLRIEELFTDVFDDPDVWFIWAFCPDGGFVTDLLSTVVADLRVVSLLCPAGGFMMDLLVSVDVDLLVVPVL